MPDGGTKVSSTVGAGEGVSTELVGVGVLTTGGSDLRSASISSNRGFTTRKNMAAKAPKLNKRKARIPAIINGTFDFFCATGAGNGAEDAGAWAAPAVIAGWSTGGGGGGGVTDTGGGGGGGGVGGGAAGGLAISEVLGVVPVGPVVGPVLRGSATVAG